MQPQAINKTLVSPLGEFILTRARQVLKARTVAEKAGSQVNALLSLMEETKIRDLITKLDDPSIVGLAMLKNLACYRELVIEYKKVALTRC